MTTLMFAVIAAPLLRYPHGFTAGRQEACRHVDAVGYLLAALRPYDAATSCQFCSLGLVVDRKLVLS
jgi:hypothetical protein